jgi:hypothetical protein
MKVHNWIMKWGLVTLLGVVTIQYIEEVRRRVPPKIEGYDTEVTPYVGHGYLL